MKATPRLVISPHKPFGLRSPSVADALLQIICNAVNRQQIATNHATAKAVLRSWAILARVLFAKSKIWTTLRKRQRSLMAVSLHELD